MAFLKNNTIGGTSSSSSTASYAFSSGSFTHQKQPIMPNDQKAKLLAMHRDGKANAGIYVAVVLLVYLILVIMLLCRYSKRRRTAEPTAILDSSAERGRLRLISFHNGKLTCGGDRCQNLTQLCFRCQRMESNNKSATQSASAKDDFDKEAPMSASTPYKIGDQSQKNSETDEGTQVFESQNQQSSSDTNQVNSSGENVQQPNTSYNKNALETENVSQKFIHRESENNNENEDSDEED